MGTHQPVDLPLLGLADTWDPPRWLDLVEGPAGVRPDGVWLQHGSLPDPSPLAPWVRVGTLHRDRHLAAATSPHDAEADTAFVATHALVTATMPDTRALPEEFVGRVVDVAVRTAEDHRAWRTTTWTVDQRPVGARICEWAGAWAGFSTALPEVDVVAVGFGIGPEGLPLREVESSEYGFDARQPIEWPGTIQRARRLALGEEGSRWQGEPPEWPVHADHRALLQPQR